MFDKMRTDDELSQAQLMQLLQEKVTQYRTITAAAQAFGISKSVLSETLNGIREPGPTILKALGVTEVSKRYRITKK